MHDIEMRDELFDLVFQSGNNCIQICHLGRYIGGFTVGNFGLQPRVSGAVKHNLRP